MRLLFICDDVSTFIYDEDTTFDLMRGARARGHEVYRAGVADVSLISGEVVANAGRIETHEDKANPATEGVSTRWGLADFDVVWIRKDPPFDAAYLWLTLVLEHARQHTRIVNDPRGLREANEKLYACHFAEFMPRTVVTANKDEIQSFLGHVGGKAVVKPIDGHGGGGVFALSEADPNFNAIIEAQTLEGKRAAMIQEYIPEVREGDKRVLLVNGKPIGAILRIPTGVDLRSNIHVGGRVAPAELTQRDLEITKALAPRLNEDGLWFVGLDVVGGKLTEVNVTSPTGLQQLSRFVNKALAQGIIAELEKTT